MRWLKLLLLSLLTTHATLLSPGAWTLYRRRLAGNLTSEDARDTDGPLGSLKTDAKLSSRIRVDDLSEEVQLSILRKLLYSASSKKKNIAINDRELVFNFRSWPFGWKVYDFLCHPIEKGRRLTIDFRSPHSQRKHIRVVLSFEIVDRKIELTLRYAAKGIPSRHVQIILKETFALFEEHLRNQLSVFRNRQKQLEEVAKATRLSSEAKKKKELDKIIHPEKYRKKASGNVRRTSGGDGRYRPSSETQSRRVIRRS